MTDINQFGSSTQPGFAPDCQRVERDLTDALDATLTPGDQAVFNAHIAGCLHCQNMLADAQRGIAWLEMLSSHRPEPPAGLVDRILTRTSRLAPTSNLLNTPAAGELSLPLATPVVPSPLPFVLPERPRRPSLAALLQTRFAMTAAMAFFSVALTLNLTGVRLSELHARDLQPSSLRRDVSDLHAHVLRYYESLRVVYELESRVRDLQRSDDAGPSTQTQPAPSSSPQPNPQQTSPGEPSEEPPTRHGRSSPGSHSHPAAPAGALHPATPSTSQHPQASFPTPGSITPVALRNARRHWEKGLRA